MHLGPWGPSTPQAITEFEVGLARYTPFRANIAQGSAETLLTKARDARDKCSAAHWEAHFMKAWKGTANKLDKRPDLVTKQVSKFNDLNIESSLLNPLIWAAAQAVLGKGAGANASTSSSSAPMAIGR